MRIARTLSLHVMRETTVYCGLAFLLLALVLLTQNLLRRLDDLFLVGMTPSDFGVAVRCIVPVVISYALPLAFLVGILMTLRRLGADRELEAMRNAGLGPLRILFPFVLLGLLTSALSGWLLISVEHEARRDLVQLFKNVAARGAILSPGKFRYVGPRLIFVEERDRSGTLSGVMIYDESQPESPIRIFASKGRFEFDPEFARIRLELTSGDIHLGEPAPRSPELRGSPQARLPTQAHRATQARLPTQAHRATQARLPKQARRYRRIRFEEFSYAVDVGHILGGQFGPVRPKQMTRRELETVLERARHGDALAELDQRDPTEYALEMHRRWALPFAPLLFAGVGVPIALASERRGRNLSLLLSLAFALGYYALGMSMETMARERWVTAAVAAWTPNLAFAALSFLLVLQGMRRIPR